MTPVVWSERDEPNARGWHDCTYSAVLMALIYGGFLNFPLGIYTVSEREALERSDSRPDETGSTFTFTDEAVHNRYRLTMSKPSVYTAVAIRDLLETPGLAIALAGSYRTFALDDPIRRWQWGFDGGHAVCVITLGGGKVLWLDPLATMGFKGDVISVNKAMQFAWTDNAVRYVRKDQYAGTIPDTSIEDKRVNIIKDVVRFAKPRTFSIDYAGTVNGYDGTMKQPVKGRQFPVGSAANAQAIVRISGDNPPGGFQDIPMVEVIDGYFEGLYVPTSRVKIDGSPDADEAALETAREAGQKEGADAVKRAAVEAAAKFGV